MDSYMKNIVATLFFLFCSVNANAETCLPVDGLRFEKVGTDKLLIIRQGQNYGILQIVGFGIPDNFTLRFFTATICDKAPNNEFQISGKIERVASISNFK